VTRAGTLTVSALLASALAVGTALDVTPPGSASMLGGYHVLEADFHVHSFPWSWGTLSPWDTVIEAGRQRLDVVALTPHNHTWVGRVGRSFSDLAGGPLVLAGEEIVSPSYHLLGVGITSTISHWQPAARAIDEIHRQGGVAIAAHPYEPYWPAYDAAALERLDGAELVRPETQAFDSLASELHTFAGRGRFAAIGASDYHGAGLLGYSRTFVFATERSARGVLEAVRARRTIVYDRGRPYGDPAMIALAAEHGGLDRGVPTLPAPGAARWFSRLATVIALLAALIFNRW
jgi:hypothetical protein